VSGQLRTLRLDTEFTARLREALEHAIFPIMEDYQAILPELLNESVCTLSVPVVGDRSADCD
jgi:hypothetical protein